jgi:transposase-like protein
MASRQVVLKIAGVKHGLWRAVDQAGVVLDVLVRGQRNKQAAKRLLRKLLKEADAAAPCRDHRQVRQLRRGKEGSHARR